MIYSYTGNSKHVYFVIGKIGGEVIYITKDKEPARTLPLHSSVVNTTLQAEPWQLVHLEFDYNFYMQNAREQRGEDRLAAIVHITTP